MIDPEKAKECFKQIIDGGVSDRSEAEGLVREVFDPSGSGRDKVPSLSELCSHFYNIVGVPDNAGYRPIGTKACRCVAEALHTDPERVAHALKHSI